MELPKWACPPVFSGVWAPLQDPGALTSHGTACVQCVLQVIKHCETESRGGVLVLFNVKFGTLQRALGLESEGPDPSYESTPRHLCDFGQDIELAEPLVSHQLYGARKPCLLLPSPAGRENPGAFPSRSPRVLGLVESVPAADIYTEGLPVLSCRQAFPDHFRFTKSSLIPSFPGKLFPVSPACLG